MRRVQAIVDARLRLSRADLGPELERAVRAAFEHKNPEYGKKRGMGFRYTKERPTIGTWLQTDDELIVPRGGFRRVRQLVEQAGGAVIAEDRRVRGEPVTPPIRGRLEMRGYQERGVEAGLRAENCLIQSPTGSGKTSMALALIARAGVPALVLVDSRGIGDEWLRRAQEELDLGAHRPGYIGEGIFKLQPLTVAMQQSLNAIRDPERWARIERYFGAVICDEVQTLAAVTYRRSIARLPARYRIGVSDDYHRPDRKEFLIEDEFGAVAYAVDEAELVAAGAIDEVRVLVQPTEFSAPWYRQPSQAMGKHDRLLREIGADDARNSLVADLVEREVAAGHSVLVFAHRVEHCLVLDAILGARGIPSGTMTGDDKRGFRRTHQGLGDGTVKAGVGTYKALGKGVNLPTLGRGVCATPNFTSREPWRQVRGRICRPTGDSAIWVLWDRLPLGNKPLRNLTRWNRVVQVAAPEGMIEASAYLKR